MICLDAVGVGVGTVLSSSVVRWAAAAAAFVAQQQWHTKNVIQAWANLAGVYAAHCA